MQQPQQQQQQQQQQPPFGAVPYGQSSVDMSQYSPLRQHQQQSMMADFATSHGASMMGQDLSMGLYGIPGAMSFMPMSPAHDQPQTNHHYHQQQQLLQQQPQQQQVPLYGRYQRDNADDMGARTRSDSSRSVPDSTSSRQLQPSVVPPAIAALQQDNSGRTRSSSARDIPSLPSASTSSWATAVSSDQPVWGDHSEKLVLSSLGGLSLSDGSLTAAQRERQDNVPSSSSNRGGEGGGSGSGNGNVALWPSTSNSGHGLTKQQPPNAWGPL